MARTREQNQAIYQRRKERAIAAGFTGYGQQRTALRRYREDENIRDDWIRRQFRDLKRSPLHPESSEMAMTDFAMYYRGMHSKEKHDLSPSGPKAFWFVEITGQVGTYDEWERRYSRRGGRRAA